MLSEKVGIKFMRRQTGRDGKKAVNNAAQNASIGTCSQYIKPQLIFFFHYSKLYFFGVC